MSDFEKYLIEIVISLIEFIISLQIVSYVVWTKEVFQPCFLFVNGINTANWGSRCKTWPIPHLRRNASTEYSKKPRQIISWSLSQGFCQRYLTPLFVSPNVLSTKRLQRFESRLKISWRILHEREYSRWQHLKTSRSMLVNARKSYIKSNSLN